MVHMLTSPSTRMRLFLFALVSALLASWCAYQAGAAQAQKVYHWEQFDTEIAVNTDGSFDVAEIQTIAFEEGSFHFGQRKLPRRYFESADNWRVTGSDGTEYRRAQDGEEPYTFVLKEYPRRYSLYWYFPMQQEFTVSYRVHGGLRYYEGADQIYWKAIYPDRGAEVKVGTASVEVPADIQVYAAYVNGRDARDRASASLSDDERSIVYTLDRELRNGEDFEMRVEFTPGVVAGSAPAWQIALNEAVAADEARAVREARDLVLWGAAALVVLVGGLSLLFVHWFRAGRDKPSGLIADYLTEPPEGVRPGMVTPLLHETWDMSDIVATVVDLAQRGIIRITEGGNQVTFTKLQEDANLLPYEEAVMDGLFRWTENDVVTLAYLQTRFSQVLSTIEARLYWQVVHDGYYKSDIESVRRRYRNRIIPGLIFSVFAFLALPMLTGAPASRWVGAALGIVMLAMFLLARHMPQKTQKGSDAAARLRAFERYLRNVDQYTDMADVQRIWDRWLPFAVAFGIDKQYIDLFAQADAPAPDWFVTAPGASSSGMTGSPANVVRPPYTGSPVSPPATPVSSATASAAGSLADVSASASGAGSGLTHMSQGLSGNLRDMSAGLGAMLAATSSSFAVMPEKSLVLKYEGDPRAESSLEHVPDNRRKGWTSTFKGSSGRGWGGGSFSGGGGAGRGGGGGSGGFG